MKVIYFCKLKPFLKAFWILTQYCEIRVCRGPHSGKLRLVNIPYFWKSLKPRLFEQKCMLYLRGFQFLIVFSKKKFCMVGHALRYFSEKQHFWAIWGQITPIKLTNENKIVLQLKSTDKNLSNCMFKVKIEHSYENVVISKVAEKIQSGSYIRHLVKESQKIQSRSRNSKIWN